MDEDSPVDAETVAIEYCLWAVEQGLTPAELLDSLGEEVREPDAARWETVVEVVARVWRRLWRGNLP